MSAFDPTLEEIAHPSRHGSRSSLAENSKIARELIALRELVLSNDQVQVDAAIRASKRFDERLTALEQQSRGYAEDGALAAGRGAGDRPEITVEMRMEELREKVKVANETADYWHSAWVKASSKGQHDERVLEADAQRDTARAALRKIVEAYQGHCLAHQIATDALAGGEANEGSGDA